MKFTTPCFVCVEDAEKRKELLGWLQGIGYDLYQSAKNMNYPILCANMVDDESGSVYGEYEEELTGIIRDAAIDCGADIELFKALAAINCENDREQWFTDGTRWYLCQSKKVHPDYKALGYRTATEEEIIDYFKDR